MIFTDQETDGKNFSKNRKRAHSGRVSIVTHENSVGDDVGGGVDGVPAHLRQAHPRHLVAEIAK